MKRYSKSYSNYVLRKRHQAVEGGTIFERDWGTLGERHVIESGKKRVYSDSNFLFTDNIKSGNRYKTNTGEWSEPYTQDNLGDMIDVTVNDTTILDTSNDIRDYAYYGSAVELVRVSIENIIKWFPGRFWSTDRFIERLDESGEHYMYIKDIIDDSHNNYVVEYTYDVDECSLYVVENPFTIDFYTTNAVFGKYDNILRNMPFSFKQYTLNGQKIKTWKVWIRPYTECVENYTIKYDITFTYGDTDQPEHLYGILYNGVLGWLTTVKDMVVQPDDNVINDYFKNLEGFEAKLLDRTHNPIYTVNLITPIELGNNTPDYMYAERLYSWPHNGYCIDVDSIPFVSYVNSLYEMANIMDELWCNNIWRSMTHEAITNFDWSYTRQYEIGQEEEGIFGGTRMEGVLKIWGRFYDDIKRYVDSIDLKNCVTYDNERQNLANAELSDKASLLGWEIFSTKPNTDDNLYLSQDFIDNYITKLDQDERWGGDASVSYGKWYNSRNVEQVSQNAVDNDFMKRLILSTGEIFKTKGTKQAIEMVFGMFGIGNYDKTKPDFEFKERYYSVVPKKRDDIFYYYEIQNSDEVNPDDYVIPSGEYESLDVYLEANPASETSIPKLNLNGNYYDLKSMTVGEFCQYMVTNKIFRINYEDDEFSGSPIKDVYINNEHYIVPYFIQGRVYDGNVQFETRGGWGKLAESGYDYDTLKTQEYDYLETIPYTETTQNVSSLLLVNPFNINYKRIYYVADISDLSNYVESIPQNVSHLFKLMNTDYPNQFSSWRNIPNDGYIDPTYEIFNGITEDDVKLAQYCDTLGFDNIGNNPHCGYSGYDLGNEYLEHIKTPFKTLVDNFGFNSNADTVSASQFKFEVTEHRGEKIVNLIGNTELEYILPSKILTITNNIDNNCYKNYLKNIILKYVTQVIPSTTILILENFEGGECEPEPPTPTGDYYYYTSGVNRLPANFSIDDCTSFDGSPVVLDNGIRDLTIIAVPENMNVTLTYVSDGITSTVDECGDQNCLVRISDSYVNGLPSGYKVLQYYTQGISTDSAEISLEFVDNNYYYTIDRDKLPIDFSIDNCTISNKTSINLSGTIKDLTIIIVPEHRNVTLSYVSDGIASTVGECGEQSCLVRISKTYVRNVPIGYKVLQYYMRGITATQAEINLE